MIKGSCLFFVSGPRVRDPENFSGELKIVCFVNHTHLPHKILECFLRVFLDSFITEE